jgi:hypothetical protein
VRPTDGELQKRWWHRLFKVLRGIAIPVSLVPALWLAAVVVSAKSSIAVERVTLSQWAVETMRATPGRRVVSTLGFLADRRGDRIGCVSAGNIVDVDGSRLTDTASQCTLPNTNATALVAVLEKGFPEHRVHVRNGVTCLVPRDLCGEGQIVRYGYERVYTISDAALLVLIPVFTVLVTIVLLNFFYYRLVMYVVFGNAQSMSGAQS